MKRVNAIIKVKDKITEIFSRKADRILRGVDQAIACAEDNADEAKESAYDIMNTLGDASSKEDSDKLQNLLNKYAEKMEEADRWTAYAKYFKELKDKLNEEVEVE